MHELSLLISVVRAVERAIAGSDGSVPRLVALRVGTLSGAEPEALESAWLLAVAGTAVDGARLVLELVEATVWCPGCERDVVIDEFYALRCPVCDRPSAVLTGGRELEIAYLEIEVPDHE